MIAHIIGLGPTLSQTIKLVDALPGEEYGVNDVWRVRKVNHVVVVDPPGRFLKHRFDVIKSCTPTNFYSYNEAWCIWQKERFQQILFSRRFDVAILRKKDEKKVPQGLDSTFIACCIAYRNGAKKIITHGVDITDHPDLGENEKMIVESYRDLWKTLRLCGTDLFCAHESSAISKYVPVFDGFL